MAENSLFWSTNGTGDGTAIGYATTRWQAFLRKTFLGGNEANAGVLKGIDNQLAVSGVASPITVATGAAIVHSFFYENDAALNLAITTPVVGTTGFRVVLRALWAAQTVRAVVIKNTDGVAAIPAGTQTANTQWDLTIATGTITTGGVIALTDLRVFARASIGGAGSGLDSDLLDGQQGTHYLALANATGTLATAQLANDAVDDTKLGNRAPQFYRRIGGNASNWSTVGTATHTPGMVRMQAGVTDITLGIGSGFNNAFQNYPVAFSNTPIVIGSIAGFSTPSLPTDLQYMVYPSGGAGSTQIAIHVQRTNTAAALTLTFNWLAIGPE